MKTNKFYRLSCVILLLSFSVEAQIGNLQATPGQVLREDKGTKYTGSKYLYDSYKNGLIMDYDGDVTSVLIKFDGHKNEIEVYNNGDPVLIKKYLYPEIRMEFFDEVAERKVSHLLKNKFKVPGYNENYYFEVLDESDRYSILKDFKVDIIEIKEAGYGEGAEVTLKYVPGFKYFILGSDNKMYRIEKLNKSEVLSEFNHAKDDLKSFIKSEKLKFKDDVDLIEVVRFLDGKGKI